MIKKKGRKKLGGLLRRRTVWHKDKSKYTRKKKHKHHE